MKCFAKFLTTAAVVVAPAIAVAPVPARAYPIDCAILLCLAGGWPASAECTTAKIEFVRRITPFPIEPPLQIWRCPLGARYEVSTPTERLWSIATLGLPAQSPRSRGDMMRGLAIWTASGPTANVDISDPTYDFVRSIKVYHIDWHHRDVSSGGGNCGVRKSMVQIGTYGTQGDFSWHYIRDIRDTPAWLGYSVRQTSNCDAAGMFRGVGVEWTDYFGNHGHEVVTY